jgi:hypothetical protein
LASDETAFLLDAVEHFCATRCPLRAGEGSRPVLTWREGVHGGAIERVCRTTPAAWQERFAQTKALRPLSIRGEAWA